MRKNSVKKPKIPGRYRSGDFGKDNKFKRSLRNEYRPSAFVGRWSDNEALVAADPEKVISPRVTVLTPDQVEREWGTLMSGLLAAQDATDREIDHGAKFLGLPLIHGQIPLSHRAIGALFAPFCDSSGHSRAEVQAMQSLVELSAENGTPVPKTDSWSVSGAYLDTPDAQASQKPPSRGKK